MSPGKKGLLDRSSSTARQLVSIDIVEWLMLTVLLEVLLAGSHQLDGSELVAIRRQSKLQDES
jgi:hypothetical protein